MENTMRRLLFATMIGLGLLAGGGVVGSASARPVVNQMALHASDRPALVTPVHDNYRRPYYAPPPRHWHRPGPRWHDYSRHERRHDYRRDYRYGSRW